MGGNKGGNERDTLYPSHHYAHYTATTKPNSSTRQLAGLSTLFNTSPPIKSRHEAIPSHTTFLPVYLPFYPPHLQLTTLPNPFQTHLVQYPVLFPPPAPLQQARETHRRQDSAPGRGYNRHSLSHHASAQGGHGINFHAGDPRGGISTMTSTKNKSKMPGANAGSSQSSSRPPLPSYRSSTFSVSVPSTPQTHSRRLAGSRSPSPHAAVNNSPRSVHSESHTTTVPFRNQLDGCPFEAGMARARRRMPYSLGGEKLEKEKRTIKAKLSRKDEQDLTTDMRELYNRLLPDAESEGRRAKFLEKLENILNEEWPGNDIKVHVFGSSGNMLCSNDSDVDVCITTSLKELEKVCKIAKLLAREGMEKVVCVSTAKVPIVKIWDPEFQVACDMNVNNTLALENTRMIKTYVLIDERVRPLAMIIKHWTKNRILNDAALGGTLSSYTWICMIINFLQTRKPPVLPSLHERLRERPHEATNLTTQFADNLEQLSGFGRQNKETIGELLFHFFRRYGHELDYEASVISVRQGRIIPKTEKGWHIGQNNRLCVEEPFNIVRNLGNTADDFSFRGLHLELRRAFSCISDDVDLAKCCEPYVFPREEERIWERPPPKPLPVFERPPPPKSHHGRGGKGGSATTRAPKSNSSQSNRQYQHQPRRASGGATFMPNIANGHVNPLHQPQIGTSANEFAVQAQAQQNKVQQDLYRYFQYLRLRENELRNLQRVNEQRAFVHPDGQLLMRAPNPHDPLFRESPMAGEENTNANPAFRQEVYLYPQFPVALQQQRTSTNPPSPSLNPAMPESRRSIHRGSVPGSYAASIRSHSQPAARNAPPPIPYPMYPVPDIPIDPITAQVGAPIVSTEDGSTILATNDGSLFIQPAVEDSSRKEYIGFGFSAEPVQPVAPQNVVLQQIPPYESLRRRSNHPSPASLAEPFTGDVTMPAGSLSPRMRGRVSTNGSGSSFAYNSERGARPNSVRRHEDVGPVIVDGSASFVPPDTAAYVPMTFSGSTSTSDDRGFDTPGSVSDSQSQDRLDFGATDPSEQPSYAQRLMELQNQSDNVPYEMTTSMGGSMAPRNPMVSAPSPLILPLQFSEPTQPSPSLQSGLSYPQRQNAYERVSALPHPAMQSPSSRNFGEDQKEQLAPLLSPVLEMRTPSPTTTRKSELLMGYSGNNKRHSLPTVRALQPQPPPTPAPAPGLIEHEKRLSMGNAPAGYDRQPLAGQRLGESAQVNGWQQPNSKRTKSKRNSKAKMDLGSAKPGSEGATRDAEQQRGG